MKTAYDCIPCFLRQALNAARLATPDERIHAAVLREVLKAASVMDLDLCPPLMGQHIHRTIRAHVGSEDPYKQVKDRFNTDALSLYDELKAMIAAAADPFDTAARLAIAGNIIDFGVDTDVDPALVRKTITDVLSRPIIGSVADLEKAVRAAQNILYLGDNTGEIVFDRLFIEILPTERVTFAVRGKPIINDATLADAAATGMTDLVPVIENGTDVPGTVLEQCTETFRDAFEKADLIISKGQGNFETLSESSRPIFFLLKAKCPVVAAHIGCKVGDALIVGPRQ